MNGCFKALRPALSGKWCLGRTSEQGLWAKSRENVVSLKSHGDRPRPFGCSRKGSFDPVAGVPGAGSEGLPRGEAHEAAHLTRHLGQHPDGAGLGFRSCKARAR